MLNPRSLNPERQQLVQLLADMPQRVELATTDAELAALTEEVNRAVAIYNMLPDTTDFIEPIVLPAWLDPPTPGYRWRTLGRYALSGLGGMALGSLCMLLLPFPQSLAVILPVCLLWGSACALAWQRIHRAVR